MMFLIDLGNSAIKWATLAQNHLGPQKSLLYQTDKLDSLLTQAWLSLDVPLSGVWVSNVAGDQTAEILTHWITFHWKLKPTFIKTSRFECGIINGYKSPEKLGVDRWLALIGAHQLEKGKLCVVDCGTAVTLDVLSANGYHQGGLIIPGVMAMHKALFRDTHALAPLKKTLTKHSEKSFLAITSQLLTDNLDFRSLSLQHVLDNLSSEYQGGHAQTYLLPFLFLPYHPFYFHLSQAQH